MNTADSSLRSKTSPRLIKIVISALILIAIGFNVLAPFLAVRWSRASFPGALFYPGLIVSDTYNPDWRGHKVGLQIGDALTAVDETPVSSGRELYLLLREKESEGTVSLKLTRSDNSSATLPITLETFSWHDFIIFFGLPYGIGLIYLALGLIVRRLRGDDEAGNVFVSFCGFVSMLAGGIFDLYTLHFLIPVWVFALPLSGAGLLHLGLIFPTETRLSRYRPWLRITPYLIALALGLATLYSFYFSPDLRLYLTIRLWNVGFLSLAVILFLGLQLYARLSTLSPLIQQLTSIIFGGSLIGFGPAALWTIANILGFEAPFAWPIFAGVFAPFVVFPIVITYAMLRYRVLDLDILFNRGVVYTLLTLIVAVVYFLIVSFLSTLLQDALFNTPFILAVFVVVLVIFLDPLKQHLGSIVNRLFLRETFDYRQALQNYGRGLISTPLKTDRILEMLVRQANEALMPEQALVFLRDATMGAFKISYQQGGNNLQTVNVRFGLSDDLAQWLADTNNILQISPSGTVSTDIKISREELARLNMLHLTLCVPLLGAEHLLGWLALGLKKSGQPYTSDDLLFLATLASQTTIALENAQLLEEANQRAAELEALQQISIEIQGEAESDKLLTSVVEQATRLLQAEGGMVYLLESDNKTLKVVVSYNLDRDYTGCTINASEDVAGRVLTLGKSVVLDHYRNFSNRAAEFKEAKFGAVLGVPLRWSGRARGVLLVTHRLHGLRFKESDIWLMELFATQSAIALEQSRLLQEARRTAHQLTTLSEVSGAISSTLDLDTALQRVMDRAVQILSAEAGSLLLMDTQGRNLTFEVVLGPTGKELLGVKTPVGKGIVGTVAETGQPLIVNDVAADPRWYVGFDQATDFKTKDLLCVPMLAHSEVIGVIEVINKQDGTIFTPEECNLLMSFAAQAAIAIENAQRFTRTDQALAVRVQELQALQLFDESLQTSLELDRVLDMTLTHAMDALGASMGLMGVIRNDDGEPGLYLPTQRAMPTEMGRYKKDPWPLTRGILGRVVRTGEPALVNDLTQTTDYVPKTHRTRSLLIVPIFRDERVIGVINLESTDPHYFTEEDLAFVTLLVSHTAIAIDNAQLFEQVKRANQAKSEFMSTASHELKIPMTSIKGYAKLLQMGAGGSLTDQQKEFLTIISNNVDRMDRLVGDLLDVSRIEAGRIRLEIQAVQIGEVIHDVVESVQTQVKRKDLHLTLDIAENLPEIRADYGRMVQIVTNLVSNAYKYTPPGGDITVIAKPYYQNGNNDLQGVMVTVKDTGYGISEEDKAKIFTNFFRSGDQNIRDEPGTGLGLSITKKMVETHGGELTFESEVGKGSSFTFTALLVSKIPPGVEVIER
jgi:GAF domain-containing protein